MASELIALRCERGCGVEISAPAERIVDSGHFTEWRYDDGLLGWLLCPVCADSESGGPNLVAAGDAEIIHTPCGNPVEECFCSDARVSPLGPRAVPEECVDD